MARFGISDADKYGNNGNTAGYFKLSNDKDTAHVRFLFDGIEDVEGLAIHQVEIGGKKRYVNCLREYGQPISDCPMCAANIYSTAKYFIPMVNVDSGDIVVWERGKKFGQKLSSMCARYPHLVSHVFEIERNGKTGDKETTYEVYEVGHDEDVSLEDFELPEVLGTMVLDKTAEDMNYYLQNGDFPAIGTPNGNSTGNNGGFQRREEHSQYTRRTPANRGDKF